MLTKPWNPTRIGSHAGTYTPLHVERQADGSLAMYAKDSDTPMWTEVDGCSYRVGAIDGDHGTVYLHAGGLSVIATA